MARTKPDPMIVRPSCPRHPGSRVRLDGFRRCEWNDAHRRPRYRCVTVSGTRGHSFSVPVAVRQPTERHPDSGAACPTCEHVYGRHEGVKTGRHFVFGQAEIARLFLRGRRGDEPACGEPGAAPLDLPGLSPPSPEAAVQIHPPG